MICKDCKVFIDILELLYTYEFETEPDYNKIIFMFEKIALDMNIVPNNKNLDWMIDGNDTVPNENESINLEQISNESNIILLLDCLEICS